MQLFASWGPYKEEHQFQEAGDPLRRPKKSTKKGQAAVEANELVAMERTLLFIVT